MATLVLTSCMTLEGSAWTGTSPGAGNPTVSGTITSAVDFSDHIRQVNINLTRNPVDFTNFGAGGFVENKPGLQNSDLSIDFYGDFATGSNVDAVFGPAAIAGTLLYLDIKPTNSARGTSNPSYVFAVYITSYPPLAQAVGEASMISVGFMQAGKFARLTA